jgi:FAD/FMN-containing dehydrogenase
MTTIGTSTQLGVLRRSFRGRLIEPHDDGYDEARTLFNAMVDRRPVAIAQCAGVDDVAAAIHFARDSGLPLAVRSGGHSVAGASMCDDGIVIDVRPLNGIEIDAERRVARVGAGCTWGEFDRAAQQHGLATTGGRVSSTGVAGLTLGGGSGWLERKHGLTCDNLIAVELVTADGEHIRASSDEHPDLFWALHGGGGNFGVATSFEFRLHPVGPEVYVLLAIHRADGERELLEAFRAYMAMAPDSAGLGFAHFTGPAGDETIPPDLVGEPLVMLAGMYAGPVDEGKRALAPLRDLGTPVIDESGPMLYTDFQCAIDDPPGYRNYWTAEYLTDIGDEALDLIAAHSARTPRGPSQTFIVPWGGAVARAGEDDTPMAKRDASWVVHPFALWDDPADDDAVIAWGRGLRDALAPHATAGVYLNFIGDEGDERIRAAFGEDAFHRLSVIKANYDPDNVFRLNHNIKPSPARSTTRAPRAGG